MRIILADDERLVRLSIRNMVEELHEKKQIPKPHIEEASSGTELNELLLRFKPHVAFVDIRMPGCSGLDVIEDVAAEYPSISWVMLTGYAEFNYAKRAIQIGVMDYLVKPASIGDIERIINRVAEHGRNQVQSKQYYGERKLVSVLHRTHSAEFDAWFRKRLFFGGVLMYLATDGNSIEVSTSFRSIRERDFRVISDDLEKWNLEWAPDNVCAYHLLSDNGNIITAISGDAAYTSRMDERRKSQENAKDSFFNWVQSLVETKKWKLSVVEEFCEIDQFLKRALTIEQAFYNSYLEKDSQVMSEEQRIPGSAGRSANRFSVHRREQVERAVAVVKAKYCQEIGLAQIADELGLTPNYLSTEFKRITGVNFTEYITKLRMQKAADLLKEPGMSVKKAASTLGYISSRYFSKLFMSSYGRKPSEYIEEMRG